MPGQKIKLECTEKIAKLKYFHKWSSSVEGIIEDPYACTTVITMPFENVTVKPVGASWKPVEIRTESLKEVGNWGQVREIDLYAASTCT